MARRKLGKEFRKLAGFSEKQVQDDAVLVKCTKPPEHTGIAIIKWEMFFFFSGSISPQLVLFFFFFFPVVKKVFNFLRRTSLK